MSDNQSVGSSEDETDDTEPLDHDYNLPQVKIKKFIIRGKWSKDEEDNRVIQLVNEYGPKRWTLISKHLKGRTGKQCRERWHYHLNPSIKKTAWIGKEDQLIYQLHRRLGNRWAEIAKYLPGRLLMDTGKNLIEPLDFGNMSSLDLIGGMEVNCTYGCTPIKFSHRSNGGHESHYENYEKKPSPNALKTISFQAGLSTPSSILRRGKYK